MRMKVTVCFGSKGHLHTNGALGITRGHLIVVKNGMSVSDYVNPRFCYQIDRLSTGLGRLSGWLTTLMVLVMSAIVTLRYGFNVGWIWLQESVIYLHAAVIMLSIGFTLLHNEHVRVDVFYRGMSAAQKAKVDLFGHCAFLLPTNLFILFMSYDYVARSWSIFESSQQAGGLPMLYIVKSLLIVMPLLLIFQGVSEIIKILVTKEPK